MFQALRIRDFRLLWAGGLVSDIGTWLLVLAIPAHVFLVTGSVRAAGLTVAAEYTPMLLLGPLAGVWADRWDRRRLMIAANLFCAGAVAVMLLGTAPGRYWVLYVALIAENSGSILYGPAMLAHTPVITGTGPMLTSANSLNSFGSGTVRLIGGPLGGVLLALIGVRWLICADALSYLVAAAAIAMMSRAGRPEGRPAASRIAREFAEGVRALCLQPVARGLLPVVCLFLAANASLTAVLIPFGVTRLGGSEPTGYLLACLGVGFLLGAPLVRWLLDRASPRSLLAGCLAATAAAYFLLFASASLTVALPAAVGVGMAGSMCLVVVQTTVQRVIANALLGRVVAVFATAEAALTLGGSAAGPFVAQAVGFTGAGGVAATVTLAAAILTWLAVPNSPPARPGRPRRRQLSPASPR